MGIKCSFNGKIFEEVEDLFVWLRVNGHSCRDSGVVLQKIKVFATQPEDSLQARQDTVNRLHNLTANRNISGDTGNVLV